MFLSIYFSLYEVTCGNVEVSLWNRTSSPRCFISDVAHLAKNWSPLSSPLQFLVFQHVHTIHSFEGSFLTYLHSFFYVGIRFWATCVLMDLPCRAASLHKPHTESFHLPPENKTRMWDSFHTEAEQWSSREAGVNISPGRLGQGRAGCRYSTPQRSYGCICSECWHHPCPTTHKHSVGTLTWLQTTIPCLSESTYVDMYFKLQCNTSSIVTTQLLQSLLTCWCKDESSGSELTAKSLHCRSVNVRFPQSQRKFLQRKVIVSHHHCTEPSQHRVLVLFIIGFNELGSFSGELAIQ